VHARSVLAVTMEAGVSGLRPTSAPTSDLYGDSHAPRRSGLGDDGRTRFMPIIWTRVRWKGGLTRLGGIGSCGLLSASVAIAGCGGSGAPASFQARVNAQKPSSKYVVRMTGSSESPPTHGQGDAILALHNTAHAICYRFAHLHGLIDATTAQIMRGTSRQTGSTVVSLAAGSRLHHRGCVRVPASVMSAITAYPAAYYVQIHSAGSPGAIIRAQL
jgi:hypothetical protein